MPDPVALKLTTSQLDKHIEVFQTEFLDGKSPETIGTYSRSLNEFGRWFRKQRGRFGFRVKDVELYRTYLAEERELSDASVSTYLTALRRLCDYLVSIGQLESNPAANVRGNKRPSVHSRDVLSADEVEKLLSEIKGNSLLERRDRAIISLMVYAGLSEIELVRADYKDLEQTLLGWFLRVQGKGKQKKDAQLALDDHVVDVVQHYLSARGNVSSGDPLIVSHGHRSDGERLRTRTIRSRVNYRLKQSGLKRQGISPHSLTHTAPVLWLQDGMDLGDVQRRMRHGSLETTMLHAKRSKQTG